MKYCEWCGKELDETKNRFCNTSCSAYWRNKNKPHSMSEVGRKHNAEILRNRWKDPSFREKKIQYMKEHNPVYIEGVVEKTKQKMLIRGYENNYKYGNGKISVYEQIAYETLSKYGFEYNKSISVNKLKKLYPERCYPTNYKPDFINLEKKICIEVDGNNHTREYQILLDKKKDECLRELGYIIIRITHTDIDNGILGEIVKQWEN